VNLPAVLDVIERLLTAANHPDIVKVERYGTGTEAGGPTAEKSKTSHLVGVKVHHQSTSTASLWGSVPSGVTPAEPPAELPAPRLRAPRLVLLVAQLLDAARPAEFTSWQLFTVDELGSALPYAIGITCADGSKVLLQASSAGASVGREPDEDPFPDWQVPSF
jgi:hypothetical protein